MDKYSLIHFLPSIAVVFAVWLLVAWGFRWLKQNMERDAEQAAIPVYEPISIDRKRAQKQARDEGRNYS